jgi:hypothetical protein
MAGPFAGLDFDGGNPMKSRIFAAVSTILVAAALFASCAKQEEGQSISIPSAGSAGWVSYSEKDSDSISFAVPIKGEWTGEFTARDGKAVSGTFSFSGDDAKATITWKRGGAEYHDADLIGGEYSMKPSGASYLLSVGDKKDYVKLSPQDEESAVLAISSMGLSGTIKPTK